MGMGWGLNAGDERRRRSCRPRRRIASTGESLASASHEVKKTEGVGCV